MTDTATVLVDDPRKSKLVAGLLGVFLGQFGIHWFYLGNKTLGLTQLLLFVVGLPLMLVLVGIPIVIGVRLWSFVDAIRIFMGSINTDSHGLPLRD